MGISLKTMSPICTTSVGQPGYPLINIQKAIENGPFIVGLPFKDGDFP